LVHLLAAHRKLLHGIAPRHTFAVLCSARRNEYSALQITPDAISNMTAEARSTCAVQTTAPHSLQVISD
jgi:hypothetical protein